MIAKLEKVLDLVAEALSLYIEDKRRGRGENLPFRGEAVLATLAPAPAASAAPAATRGRPRKEKVVAAAAEAPATESPFGTVEAPKAAASASKLSAEEAFEAGRRGQEVMGLFIRRYLKASPTGLERAKKILVENLGAPRNAEPAWKLEHLAPEDWLKLTPIFESELEKAA